MDPKDPKKRFAQFVSKSTSPNGCWLWVGSLKTNGYGQFMLHGKPVSANRLALLWAIGEPPSPKMDAAHSCRQRAGVNPAHLSWKTRSENQQDRVRDGTSNRGERCGSAKLGRLHVSLIRACKGLFSQRQLAKDFGVDQSTISNIQSEKTWNEVSDVC